jgi:hypothetical protein
MFNRDVRKCYVPKLLQKEFSKFDVYCGSYIKHKDYIKTLGKKNYSYLIDPGKFT